LLNPDLKLESGTWGKHSFTTPSGKISLAVLLGSFSAFSLENSERIVNYFIINSIRSNLFISHFPFS
jgi:hypothetical protein